MIMKTLYSKFNKERSPRFQIETRIYIDEKGNTKISKIPLCVDAKPHIKKMQEYYDLAPADIKTKLASCTINGAAVDFEYIKGRSFTDLLLNCVENNDRITFIDHIHTYYKILQSFITKSENFIPSKEFIEVFGNVELAGMIAASNLNVDLIFDNILFINDDVIKTIDYEWVFPFAVPIKFIIWRAIYGFYVKHATMLYSFIQEDLVYSYFDIGKEKIQVFKQMDANFLNYIYGHELNYETILRQYECPKTNVLNRLDELQEKKKGYSQIFIDEGNGYSDTLCETYEHIFKKGEEITVSLSFENYKAISNIRFDPLPFPGVIVLKDCKLSNKNGDEVHIENFLHNASLVFSSYYVFETSDPQCIIKEEQLKKGYDCISFIFAYIPLSQFDKRAFTEAIKSRESEIQQKQIENNKLQNVIVALQEANKEIQNTLFEEQTYTQKVLYNKQELEKELMKNMEKLKEMEI